MKKIITIIEKVLKLSFLTTIIFFLCGWCNTVNAQYTNLINFAGATNGSYPFFGSLISDGTFLYGVTSHGGTTDDGTIFKIMPNGTGYVKLLDFFSATNGHGPIGSLISDGTFLYGMTEYGNNSFGTIFKIMPNGTGYVKLYEFIGNSNGLYPCGSLFFDGTFLYGMTSQGGTYNMGTIFKIMPNGTGYVKLLDFAGAANGKSPHGSLISDGTFLYGVTSSGGTNQMGTIFKIMPNGTGFVKLLDFAGTTNGKLPYGSLFFDGTFLYGTTVSGGTNDKGTIFKIMPNGTGYVKLLDFAGATGGSDGSGPRSLISDGAFLYGMTSLGGGYDKGTLFKIMPNGTGYVKLLDFAGSTNGSQPLGSLISDGTFLYGMTWYGGTNDMGTVFKYCNSFVTPSFTVVAPICSGAALSPLPTTSNNGITGTWNPALNNTVTTTYTFTPTAGQCATTSTLSITVNQMPNITTSTNANTITANQTGATYQWIDCDNSNSNISGATNQSFAATANGNYAVIVTLVSCSDTSACVSIIGTGLKNYRKVNTIFIYPNPTNEIINISSELNGPQLVSIINVLGQVVLSKEINIVSGADFTIDIKDQSSGVYILKVGNTTQKIIIQ